MRENWKDVRGYKGLYQISSLGKVRSLTRKIYNQFVGYNIDGKILKLYTRKCDGRVQVNLNKNGISRKYYVARLVGKAFVKNPFNKPELHHIKPIKTNNKASNLRWVTDKEHKRLSQKQMVIATGERHGATKLTTKQVLEIRKKYAIGNISQAKLGNLYGTFQGTIWCIVNRINRKYE